ncbi:hypothetical protein AAIA72_09480 [Hahella sp. SMD15-11]|uniref:Uncharacterized protein n=1 Tax=Thermohahella caldifontis TaxID=3142973 RepID=A0AB39USL8_9GAMM
MKKNTIKSIAFVAVITVAASLVADIPYIYTLCGISVWVAVGHLITLDDDMPGEWSNPDENKKHWHQSLLILFCKFAVALLIGILIFVFPVLVKFGA